MRFQGEVAGDEEAHNRTRIVALKRLGARGQKERVVFAPDCQKRRVVGAEIVLECRIQCHVTFVVAEKVELHFIGTGTRQIEVVEILAIWRDQRLVGYAMSVLPAGRLRGEEGAKGVSVCFRRVLPVGPNRTPTLAEAFVVGIAVLRDDGSDPLRVADGEPEACRRAVVKDVHCKPIEAEDLGKAIDYAGDVVESVTEVFSRRHIGLTEAGKVWRDNMKSVGEEWHQVAEHVTRARKTVQQ